MLQRKYLTFIVLALPPLALGQLGVDVHTRFDIGEPTRRLIQNYPPAIEAAILDTVDSLGPKLQQNLDMALQKVTNTLDQQRLKWLCSTEGAMSAAHDIPVVLPRPQIDPMDDFGKVEKKKLNGLSRSSSPKDYGYAYSDLANRAGIIDCQEEPTTKARAMATERRLRYEKLTFIWLRLLHTDGKNAKDCVAVEREHTQKLIKLSDERDVEAADAREKFKQVTDPPWTMLFDPSLYEETLSKFLKIQDQLIWAKFEREQEASNLLADAKAKYTNVDSDVTQGLIFARPATCVPWTYAQFARQKASSAEATSEEIEKLLAQIMVLDSANQAVNVKNLTAELSKKEAAIEVLKDSGPTCR